jgi:hypothetical protein
MKFNFVGSDGMEKRTTGKDLDRQLLALAVDRSEKGRELGQQYAMVLTKEQVAKRNVVGFAAGALWFSSNKEQAVVMAGKTPFMFLGWADDPTPVWDNSEVARFVEEITDCWPYWLLFLDMEEPGARSLVRIILGVRGRLLVDGQEVLVMRDGLKLEDAIKRYTRLLSAAASLCDFHGIERSIIGSAEGISECLLDAPGLTE